MFIPFFHLPWGPGRVLAANGGWGSWQRTGVTRAQTPREGRPETWPEARSSMRDMGWGCPGRVPAPQGNVATAARSPHSSREVVHLGCNINPPSFQMQPTQWQKGRGGPLWHATGRVWPQFPASGGEQGQGIPSWKQRKAFFWERGSPWLCPCSYLCPPGRAFQPRGLSLEVPVRRSGG